MNQRIEQNTALMLKHKVREWIGTRKQIQFWLRVDKALDCEVLDIIAWLKSKGLFRSSVMTGLRVMYAYMHNDFDTIYEALPNLKGQGCEEDLSVQIAELKRLILEQGSSHAIPSGGLLMSTAIALPVAVVSKAVAVSAGDIADNFLSMFN